MTVKRLEFWADSFHEGLCACEELKHFFKLKDVEYENGFIPVYTYEINTEFYLVITVLGSYKNWSPLPEKINDLIDWGKPDLIAYDPDKDEILFAVEETAAVPTGNQALQRCERIYGSLRMKIPFWYLLGEFGVHVDGGVRRDSIWPTVLGLKLSCAQKTPCIVLHYSDKDNPEDYSVGEGVRSLYSALSTQIEIYFGLKNPDDMIPVLTEQFGHMLDFVKSQAGNMVSFIPESEKLYMKSLPNELAQFVVDSLEADKVTDFFNWGKTDTLPKEIYEAITKAGTIKDDSLIDKIEDLVDHKMAYTLSGNAGSRPQDVDKVKGWIEEQKDIFEAGNKTSAEFAIKVTDFPASQSGRLHVTTAKNVFYLIDSVHDIEKAIKDNFDRLSEINITEEEVPVFFYISNSIKPGRIFGDPFTGQLSAFINIFTKNIKGDKTRLSIAYYPHQSHTQLFTQKSEFRKNKGITLMRELLDYAIFQGGVLVELKTGKIV